MGIYWLLSDYGRSVLRPLVAIIASVFLFHAAYSKLLSAPDAAAQPAFGRAVWAFTIANAVPFVGALTLDKDVKEVLLCTGVPRDNSRAAETGARTCNSVPTVAFQLVALGQSILSALLVFFLALALRNFFKLH
jgi:hypothetical protein